ncbi:pilus assembly protein PilP [Vibrio atypicus]|uniref:pilus assembly protein PilP n=1 Tax=Vibrio atypicus TaxID=558271 RepID=UPI0013599D4A|nr:pilus assembly protein PilP [Vibrio atypicus]
MKTNRLLALLSFVLMGCQANQESLDGFVAQVERKARQDVVDLAPVIDFRIAKYQGHEQRAPFVLPQAALALNQPLANKECWQPTPRAQGGQLEKYPLSKLRLKGMMSRSGKVSGLVQTPNGKVVKVNVGHYIGQHNGKVTEVTANYLKINETLPDGLGCWNKRNVKLALK